MSFNNVFEINNPKPVPSSDLVANFENSFGRIIWSIPYPVSLTLMFTLFSVYFFSNMICIVPVSVNLIELLNKLEITWFILILSANINILYLFLSFLLCFLHLSFEYKNFIY